MKKEKKYYGAGIVLIEKCFNQKTNKTEPAIILFERGDGKYTLGGGQRDDSDISSKHTAARELMEESKNLFRFSPESLDTVILHKHYVNTKKKKLI